MEPWKTSTVTFAITAAIFVGARLVFVVGAPCLFPLSFNFIHPPEDFNT